ncbi:TonB-dependent receptor [Winogradskyella psychrotolerans RS-3]|uniref:TonB-dependent receptor n=1 Tax=Winogradskyella psychrotolerans RS-3 TaxID=641526 RepID=S7VIN1_9FLAO|nr:TonB-dependent receptor [Winogradskyella psychrotolerans]EPR70085.1 TonB-dependent receptor [Winogradskyella psychrotolerans RS-3]
MIKSLSLFFAILLSFSFLSAQQTGTVTGKIFDGEFNDVLPFANVVIQNTATGTTTDFDGEYKLTLDEGTYTLVFSFVGYETKAITDVKIEANKVLELNVTLNPSSSALSEVVITTSARRNTEESVLNLQRNSAVLLDGLSIESIKKAGASDIASAIKSVPGVSVQGGKFVYVRGLGDRYTKSILNGMDIPGLDPDKNTVQMDVFPTNILENIIVIKSGSADLPADFTGGVVDIITKDFPSQKAMSFSLSTSYNPDMTFNSNYVTYEGSSTDFLGFDSGDRDLPISPTTSVPNPASSDNSSLEGITRSFNRTLAAERQSSAPSFSFGFNYGNQFDVGENRLGLIASINYKNETLFYEGFENGVYQKNEDRSVNTLRFDRRQIGDLGENNVLLSGLVGLSYKTDNAKYNFNVLHIQSGESRAALFRQNTEISNDIDVDKDNLEYTQRSLTNFLIGGHHSLAENDFIIDWKVSPSISRVYDKDVRLTTFILNQDTTISSDAGYPQRLWRDLEEFNATAKIDFTKKYDLFDNQAALKFGALGSYKQRNYDIYKYEVAFRDVNSSSFNYDPNAILDPNNIWTPETNSGSYIRGNFEPANSYESTQNTVAAYVSNEFKITDKLKSIVGVRAEYFTTLFTGQNNNGTEMYDNEKTIEELDLFPSANFIYEATEKSNVRLSYFRTVARPSFKEVSVVQISDLLTGLIFLGNIDLQPSYINNFDARYEFFGEKAQMFAVSAFYKRFKDPIELVAFSFVAPNQFTPRNSPEAQVLGLEFEGRKNFNFISESLADLSLNVNVSIIQSEIEMAKGAGQEYESRQQFARDGETIDDTRELQGQSPFLVNVGLNYNNADSGFETGVFYNVQGKTLEVVGFGQNPDVYTQSFNSLNFNLSKSFGKDNRSKLSLKIDNILNDDRLSQYESYGDVTADFSSRNPGTTFSLGYSMNL